MCVKLTKRADDAAVEQLVDDEFDVELDVQRFNGAPKGPAQRRWRKTLRSQLNLVGARQGIEAAIEFPDQVAIKAVGLGFHVGDGDRFFERFGRLERQMFEIDIDGAGFVAAGTQQGFAQQRQEAADDTRLLDSQHPHRVEIEALLLVVARLFAHLEQRVVRAFEHLAG